MTHLRWISSCAIRSGGGRHRNAYSLTALRPLLLANLQYSRAHARGIWGFGGWGKKGKDKESEKNTLPSIAELLKKKPAAPEQPKGEEPKLEFKRSGLAKSSIFDETDGKAKADRKKTSAGAKAEARRTRALGPREKESIPEIPGLELDPYLVTRKERLRLAKRRGALSRKQKILQSEKSHLCKSHFIKTSVKKLGPLARQISGKNVADAKVQMQFSKKLAAKEVLMHLKHAEAEAVVNRAFDPNTTYVSEAWVGRGTPDRELERRARGRINVLTKPYTSITVVLKEEKTRERIARDKEAKRWRKKPWVQLPSRPIQGQHQYYTW